MASAEFERLKTAINMAIAEREPYNVMMDLRRQVYAGMKSDRLNSRTNEWSHLYSLIDIAVAWDNDDKTDRTECND